MRRTSLLWVIMIITLLCAAICLFVLAGWGEDKKAETKSVQIIKATFDSTGQHPGTAAIQGPAKVTCLSATGAGGTCYIEAPGYSGQVSPNPPNNPIGTSGAGTVTLNCNGTGNNLACSAKVEQ